MASNASLQNDWFFVQENVELMTKRRVPLENRDGETSLSDVQQVWVSLRWQMVDVVVVAVVCVSS